MTLPSNVNNSNSVPPTAESVRGTVLPQPMIPYPASGTFTPPALATMPDAASLLRALRRRLVPALVVGLIVAAIAGTATWILMPPPKIAARIQLYVAAIQPAIAFNERTQLNNETFLRSQAFFIKDPFVISAALRDYPELTELSILKEQVDPVQWLEKEITVTFPGPEVIHISLSGDRREELKKIVSAVAQTYLDRVVNKDKSDFLERQKTIKKALTNHEERTKEKRRQLRILQENGGAISEEGMAIIQKIALDDLKVVRQDLAKVHKQLRELQVELDIRPDWVEQFWPRYAAALNGLPGPGLPINHAIVALLHDDMFVAMASPAAVPREVEEMIDKVPDIVEARKRILQQQDHLERMKQRLQPAAYEAQIGPERAKLDGLKKSMEALRNELRPGMIDKYRQQSRLTGLGSQAERRLRYRTLQVMERKLREDYVDLNEKTKQIKKEAVGLAELTREIEQDEKFIKQMDDKLKRMEVELDAPDRIRLPGTEAIIYRPDETKRKVMVTSGVAVGALALVLLAFGWFEFQSRKVHSTDEVVHGLGLNLVGTVPDASPRGWLPWSRGGGNAVYTQSMLTESVDAARTQLLHIARRENLQIVMITSALAGEGKTSLASHLAASLARAGRRTILVDSDLRNPTLHRLFERSRAPGLSELLRGEADLAAASRDTPISNLWLISAGKADTAALQALAFDTIPKLFEQLRRQYDFVIVDSCPVLPVADSLLVGQHVDAVIFSLLRQVSRLPRVYAAYQRLALLGIRMLGTVVNGTSHDLYPADYNYVASEND
jgi:succinoglycan biosynthesis transport protein ExoP